MPAHIWSGVTNTSVGAHINFYDTSHDSHTLGSSNVITIGRRARSVVTSTSGIARRAWVDGAFVIIISHREHKGTSSTQIRQTIKTINILLPPLNSIAFYKKNLIWCLIFLLPQRRTLVKVSRRGVYAQFFSYTHNEKHNLLCEKKIHTNKLLLHW